MRTGEQYEIAAGDYRATVVEVGAGLRELWRGDRPLTENYPADALPPRCCGAVLVPWPNRLRGGRYRFDGADYQLALTEPAKGNAIHGLARWQRWSAIAHSAAEVVLSVDLVPQTGWPFEVRCTVSYRLDATTGLAVTLAATNHGEAAAPFAAGAHPYLDVGNGPLDDVELLVPARSRLTMDEAAVPTGQVPVADTEYDFTTARRLGALRLDDCFVDLPVATGPIDPKAPGRSGGPAPASARPEPVGVTVTSAAGRTQLWWDAAFHAVQLFTPDDLAVGRPAVAVEPMSAPADAFNSGAHLVRLEPGTDWRGVFGICDLT